jgi:hypothetical protein
MKQTLMGAATGALVQPDRRLRQRHADRERLRRLPADEVIARRSEIVQRERSAHPGLSRRALVLALIAAAAAGCGWSGGQPAAQATQAAAAAQATQAAATAQEFISERYGFRITLTGDWSGVDALLDWDGENLQGLHSPAFATFSNPATGRTLVAAAAHAEGMELAEWRAAMVRAAPPICSESSSDEETALGGEPALAWIATCSDGDAIKLAALHGSRGYIIFMDSQTAKDAEDRRIFESIRNSFRFTR